MGPKRDPQKEFLEYKLRVTLLSAASLVNGMEWNGAEQFGLMEEKGKDGQTEKGEERERERERQLAIQPDQYSIDPQGRTSSGPNCTFAVCKTLQPQLLYLV